MHSARSTPPFCSEANPFDNCPSPFSAAASGGPGCVGRLATTARCLATGPGWCLLAGRRTVKRKCRGGASQTDRRRGTGADGRPSRLDGHCAVSPDPDMAQRQPTNPATGGGKRGTQNAALAETLNSKYRDVCVWPRHVFFIVHSRQGNRRTMIVCRVFTAVNYISKFDCERQTNKRRGYI